MFRVRSKLGIVPSTFLFIGLLNDGPEFEAEFVDFYACPVMSLSRQCLSMSRHFSSLMCLEALLWLCRNIFVI